MDRVISGKGDSAIIVPAAERNSRFLIVSLIPITYESGEPMKTPMVCCAKICLPVPKTEPLEPKQFPESTNGLENA